MSYDSNKFNSLRVKYWDEEKQRGILRTVLNGVCDKKYDIVLDIGCGNGKLTSLLDNEITVGHIYGIDISEEAIEYAKQNHMKDNTSYITQDFGIEFDCLAPELRALEGKVSLIFSSNVFTLIPNSANLAQNMYRLLSKKGEVYGVVFHPFSTCLLASMTSEKAIHAKDFMTITDPKTRISGYVDVFKGVGFNVITNEFFENKNLLKFSDFTKFQVPLLRDTVHRHLKVYDKERLKDICNEFIDMYIANSRLFTDVGSRDDMIESPTEHSLIVLRK